MKKSLILSIASFVAMTSVTTMAHASDSDFYNSAEYIQNIDTKLDAVQADNAEISQMNSQISFMTAQNKLVDQLVQKAGDQDGALQQLNLGQISMVASDLLNTAIQASKRHDIAAVQSAYNDSVELQKSVAQVQTILGK